MLVSLMNNIFLPTQCINIKPFYALFVLKMTAAHLLQLLLVGHHYLTKIIQVNLS